MPVVLFAVGVACMAVWWWMLQHDWPVLAFTLVGLLGCACLVVAIDWAVLQWV